MRRVLLSSLSGTAVTKLAIKGVEHEFATIPNVVEDVLEIICNIKGVVFRYSGENEQFVGTIKATKGKVYAGDIVFDDTVDVVNKKHFIAEISGKADLDISLTIEKGEGFCPMEKIVSSEDAAVNELAVDASFSPIVKVNHSVESIRVGKELGYDQLVLEVWTDGSVGPDEAVQDASKILIEKLQLFGSLNEEPEEEEKVVETEEIVSDSVSSMTIDDLELSARSSNCLKRAGIESVTELVAKERSELILIKNFGKKSFDEINEKLKPLGLALKV